VAYFKVLPQDSLEELRETMTDVTEDRSAGRGLNPGPLEHEAGVPTGLESLVIYCIQQTIRELDLPSKRQRVLADIMVA
jgi:hypothetical protein